MSAKWPKVKLGQVLKPIWREEKVNPLAEYRLLGARWYGGGLFIKEFCLGQEIRADRLYRVQEGDFVYNRLFAWKGSFALAGPDSDGCYVSNEFPCFEVNQNHLNANFLWFYFKREIIWNEVLKFSTGATPTSRNRLKEQMFLNLEIPLPPLMEQRRIVARIEELAAQINEARNLHQQAAEEMDAFIIAVHVSLAGSRSRKLGDILQLEEDQVPVCLEQNYPQVGVKGFGEGLFSKPAVSGMQTTYRTFNRLFDGALILSQVKGWEGAVAVCDNSLSGQFVSPEYRTFRCNSKELLPDYLAVVVSTEWFWSQLRHATRGVGARRERTRPEQFLALEMPIPDVRQQAKGVRIFRELRTLKRLQAETASELDALHPSILDKAFKGGL